MTAKGKVNASKVQPGDRIIVKLQRNVQEQVDGWDLSKTKTGQDVMVTRVTQKVKASSERGYYLHIVDMPPIYVEPIQTMWLAPEDAAGIKRAWVEALADDEIRAQKESAKVAAESPAPLPQRTPTPVRTPIVGDTVEWNGIKGTAGYVTEVDETLNRITVAWGNRVTKDQGTDIVSFWGFARDWTITTMPEDAPESRPEMETRVQAILGATGEEPAIDDSKAVPYLLTRKALEMIDVRKTLEMTDAHGIGAHGLGIYSSGEVTAMDMDVPSTPARAVYRVTLDRVGRTHGFPPMEVTVEAGDSEQAGAVVAAQVHPLARRHLNSRSFTVEVDLDEGKVWIEGGRFGEGKVTRLP